MKINFASSPVLLLPLLILTGCNSKGTGHQEKTPAHYTISLKHGDDKWPYELERRKDRYISNAHIVKDSATGMILRALPRFHDLANIELQDHLNQKMDSVAEALAGDKKTLCYYELLYLDDTLLSFIVTQHVNLAAHSYQFYNYNLVTGKKLLIDDFFQDISFRDTLMYYAKLFVGFANTLPGEDTLDPGWQETVSRSRKKVTPGMFDNFSFTEQQFQFYLCTECTDEDRNTSDFNVYFMDPLMGGMLDPTGTGKHLMVFEPLHAK
jgi:hypothetical protein